jgi:ligand-binding SRPBCC domain-containing protein
MSTHTEVSVTVDAPGERVYALVSDLTRMGEWSPETTKVVWRGGAAGPAVGAKFRGWNRKGVLRWFTDGKVVAADGTEFAFEITSFGIPVARWGYRVDAAGEGCTVTETWDDRRAGPFKKVTGLVMNVPDRAAHNRAGMEATLAKIKAAAERG